MEEFPGDELAGGGQKGTVEFLVIFASGQCLAHLLQRLGTDARTVVRFAQDTAPRTVGFVPLLVEIARLSVGRAEENHRPVGDGQHRLQGRDQFRGGKCRFVHDDETRGGKASDGVVIIGQRENVTAVGQPEPIAARRRSAGNLAETARNGASLGHNLAGLATGGTGQENGRVVMVQRFVNGADGGGGGFAGLPGSEMEYARSAGGHEFGLVGVGVEVEVGLTPGENVEGFGLLPGLGWGVLAGRDFQGFRGGGIREGGNGFEGRGVGTLPRHLRWQVLCLQRRLGPWARGETFGEAFEVAEDAAAGSGEEGDAAVQGELVRGIDFGVGREGGGQGGSLGVETLGLHVGEEGLGLGETETPDAPVEVDEFVDQLGLGGSGGLPVGEFGLREGCVDGLGFGGQQGAIESDGLGGLAVSRGEAGGFRATEFARFGFWTSRLGSVGSGGFGTVAGGWHDSRVRAGEGEMRREGCMLLIGWEIELGVACEWGWGGGWKGACAWGTLTLVRLSQRIAARNVYDEPGGPLGNSGRRNGAILGGRKTDYVSDISCFPWPARPPPQLRRAQASAGKHDRRSR